MKLTSFQIAGMTTGYIFVGYIPFCTCEARLTTDGKLLVAGVPASKIPGANSKEKRTAILQENVDSFTNWFGNGGWLDEYVKDDILVIPTSRIVILVPLQKTIMFRWAVSGDDSDLDRVQHSLASLLEDFPEMQKPQLGYVGVKDWLATM